MSRAFWSFSAAASGLLLWGIWRVAYAPTPAPPPPTAPAVGDVLRPAEVDWRGRFPNVPLVTQDGRVVRFYDDLLRGHLVTLNFFYIECEGTCPGVTSTLVEVDRMLGAGLGRELRILSITLQPERDTPERLNEYARRYGAGPRVLFLTGKPEDLELVKRSMGFSHPEDPARDLDRKRHAALLRIGNEADGWWTACPSLASAGQIAGVLRSLDRTPEPSEPAPPLGFPGGVPVELRSPEDLRLRLEWATVLDRIERLWMCRVPMDAKTYQDLVFQEVAGFLRFVPDQIPRFRSAVQGILADLSNGRRMMEHFRRERPYDGEDAGLVRRYRTAWEIYNRDRAATLGRLEALLAEGPRQAMVREQLPRWLSCLEDPPEPPAVPQDEMLVPIPRK